MDALSATMAPTFAPFPGGEPAAMIKMYWQRGIFGKKELLRNGIVCSVEMRHGMDVKAVKLV